MKYHTKKKSEIALMKAVGIPNSSIVAQHTLRFVIVSVIACIVSSAVLMPVCAIKFTRILGARGHIQRKII